jgi:hypothetical protein
LSWQWPRNPQRQPDVYQAAARKALIVALTIGFRGKVYEDQTKWRADFPCAREPGDATPKADTSIKTSCDERPDPYRSLATPATSGYAHGGNGH